ncbi:MAG TPA: hypothetical protein VMB72_10470, partial [Acidimicrobiales bacterium]|nr:hypothetical protein [Acidimicrobiales bacterium]
PPRHLPRHAARRHAARHVARRTARHTAAGRGWWRSLALVVLAGLVLVPVVLVAMRPTSAGALSARDRHGAGAAHLRRAKKHTGGTGVRSVVKTSDHVVGITGFQVGYDYTQYSHLPAGAGGNPAAVASAERLLRAMDTVQNVALMGWGAGDPEPSPGTYAWTSLDDRVEVMGSTVPATQRMITLCTAPGWMKVGGKTQEWNMDDAVAAADDENFAALAAKVAQRYDGTHRAANGTLLPKVDDFDVWNEMKGYWDSATDDWNAAGYTTMYNDVYRAIKAVRPDALVGGPYAPLGAETAQDASGPSPVEGAFGVVDPRALDVVAYWLQHKAGAQFMSMDGGPAVTDETGFASGQYFAAVAHWVRSLDPLVYPGAGTLPIVWAEFYPGLDATTGVATGEEAVAVDLASIIRAGTAGIDDMMIWEMEGTASGASSSTGEGVWTDTAAAGGGKPTWLAVALEELHAAFPPGTRLYGSTVAGPVDVLTGGTRALLVSESPVAQTVVLDKVKVSLGPYGVVTATLRRR